MMRKILKNAFIPAGVTSLAQLGVVSLESDAEDGATVVEREYEIYGRVDDLNVLAEKAERKEYQEQWGLPCGGGNINGNIRVRMTRTDDGEPVYTQTIKVKKTDSNEENEMVITKDTFDIFSRLVPTGLKKTRYVFPVRDTEFELEVDVFEDADGTQHNIVKIDLEVPEGTDVNSITMPFKLEEPRLIQPGIKSKEDLDYVRDLFTNTYEVKNPLHAKKDETVDEDTSLDEGTDDTGEAEEADDTLDETNTDDVGTDETDESEEETPETENTASIS